VGRGAGSDGQTYDTAAVGDTDGSWQLSAEEEEAWFSDGYEDELIRIGREHGCDIRRLEGRLVLFPTVVRVLPPAPALRLDRIRVTP